MSPEELSTLVLGALNYTGCVEVDGLGVFVRDTEGRVQFHSGKAPRVFIAYAFEDVRAAEKLYLELRCLGFSPWMDRKKLLPGQNWSRRVEDAIQSSDFFIALFSSRSVRKRGPFQTEIRLALECAKLVPLDEVFLIPVRLDECAIPNSIRKETHHVDLFPDWSIGITQIGSMLESSRGKS